MFDDQIRLEDFRGANTVEEIDGGGGHNRILGTRYNNVLDFRNTALISIDFVDGGDGDDMIYGSPGEDVIRGGQGRDDLYGEAGDDRFELTAGDTDFNRYSGADGYDRLVGRSGDDIFRLRTFSGEFTVEEIDGLAGDNSILGSRYNDVLDFRNTSLRNIDFIDGGDGDDVIYGSAGLDVIRDGKGRDDLYGDGGDDRFELTAGDTDFNRYSGGEGYDRLVGTSRNDVFRLGTFTGEFTVEEIDGVRGRNRILGTPNNDVLDFRNTNLIKIDVIDGGGGNDIIYGSAKADVIRGGKGRNDLYGEGGDDRFELAAGDNDFNRYSGGEGFDRLVGTLGSDVFRLGTFTGSYTLEEIDGRSGINRILGTPNNDILDFRNTRLINIAYINGGKGNDTVYGSNENDVIRVGEGRKDLYGEDGDDRFQLVTRGTDFNRYSGGDGDDRLFGTLASNIFRLSTFSGVHTVEEINGIAGHNVIQGDSGSNTLDFRNSRLKAIALIDGGAGNDRIYGSSGNDVIRGGPGPDFLSGGNGSDHYLYARGDGIDTIRDDGDSSSTDKLIFTDGIDVEDLWLVRSGSDLKIYLLAGSGSILIDDWFTNPANIIERIEIEQGGVLRSDKVGDLVELMGSIGAPVGGVISLSREQQSAVDAARRSAWR